MSTATAPSRLRPTAVGDGLLSAVERHLGITTSGLLVLALAIVGWVLARWIGSRMVFLLVYGLVAGLVVAWVLGRRKLAVDAERSEIPTRIRQGQAVDVELTLTARRRLTTIVLEEQLSRKLGETVRVPVPLLPRGEEIQHGYSFTPRLRGVYEVGPLYATWNDPFGLTRRATKLMDAQSIIVHPATELAHDRVTIREWEDPPMRPPISRPWPSGFEFYGMREYALGDDPRRIAWRATARYLNPGAPETDTLLIWEAEQGIADRVTIAIDTDMRHHAPGDPSETFEAAVRIAASLGVRHLKDGFGVTVETNRERLVAGLRGQKKKIPLLDALARVQSDSASMLDLLQRAYHDRRNTRHLVLVTPHVDDEAASRIAQLKDRGMSILLVVVVWDDSDPAMLRRAAALHTNLVEIRPGQSLDAPFRHVVGGGSRRA